MLLASLSIFVLASCTKDVSNGNSLENVPTAVSFEKEKETLFFHSVDVFRNFMEDYDQKEDEIIDFYQDGFVPYRPLDKVDEQTFLGLVQAKRSIIQKK